MYLAVLLPDHNVRFMYRLGSQRPSPFCSGGLLGGLSHTSPWVRWEGVQGRCGVWWVGCKGITG